MKSPVILFIHNFYQISGGEDVVFENEIALLESRGVIVSKYTVHNDSVSGFFSKLLAALTLSFSLTQFIKIRRYILKVKPEAVHVHNYFPVLTASVFFACKSTNTPLIHTLHNFRAVCPTATLMHNEHINEKSILGSSWWAVGKKVYRNSFLGSFAVAIMVELHKYLGTWHSKVDVYIALTEFTRKKYIDAGWPGRKILVKPNFICDPFDGALELNKDGGYCLFIGRLSEEKGLTFLLDAWREHNLPLRVVGEGPLEQLVVSRTSKDIVYEGRKQKNDVISLIKHADFIIIPSTCYEGFPMVLVEAFACGTPVLASKLGSLVEIITNGFTGLHFDVGNINDFRKKVQWLIDNPERTREMGQNARNEYLAKYTPEKNYEMLMDIYQQAIEEAKKR